MVNINFSDQAELILKNIPKINKKEIIKWYSNKKILIGGGDILEYLKYSEVKNG